MPDAEFGHFLEAQESVFERVERELQAGRKQSHWMWFIFPQLEALGKSATAKRFGIADLEQARRYLGHAILGERLRRCTRLMLDHRGYSAREILGSPDDLKFRSCMTLFREAAESRDDTGLFQDALDAFYGGVADDLTLRLLQGN